MSPFHFVCLEHFTYFFMVIQKRIKERETYEKFGKIFFCRLCWDATACSLRNSPKLYPFVILISCILNLQHESVSLLLERYGK